MRRRPAARAIPVICGLLLVAAGPGLCQPGLGQDLNDLGLGDLGGMGALGMLGPALSGMMKGQGGGGAGQGTTVIILQPAMLISQGSLYVAYNGKVMRFDAMTLKKQAEVTFAEPVNLAAGQVKSASGGPKLLEEAPAGPKPPLLPGAKPATGP